MGTTDNAIKVIKTAADMLKLDGGKVNDVVEFLDEAAIYIEASVLVAQGIETLYDALKSNDLSGEERAALLANNRKKIELMLVEG
ncbi:MAG: hypothetical protein ACRBCK_10175 [Alphaproteobacteria bacterium]